MKYLIVSVVALLSLLLPFTYANGQGEIPVDMHTGTPSIFIPTGGVSSHDLSDIVGVAYNARGLKLEESKGLMCGAGWSFQGGGTISREVRGLPDDFKGSSPDNRIGWLYGTTATDISNFSTAADTLISTCATDENAINTTLINYNYVKDTEPDIFYYSAGGISGAFVFDANQTIRLMPYQDIKIEYTFSGQAPADKRILSFKITTNNGNIYTFDLPVYNTRKTHKLTEDAQEFFQRDFKYYDYGQYIAGLTFTSEWKLSRVDSPSGAFLKYKYRSQGSSSETVKVGVPSSPDASRIVTKEFYRIANSGSGKTLSSVVSSEGDSLVIVGDPVEKVVMHDRRRNPAYVKEFIFEYQSFGALTDTTERKFLKSIVEQSACEKIPAYEFTYINVDFVSGTCALPPLNSSSKDFWGYYNGKNNAHAYPTIYVYPSERLSERFRFYPIPGYAGTQYTMPGADRTPDPIKMQIGSLESIKYPTGGVATFNYEPNDYFDVRANATFVGGGLRIKSIAYFDGVSVQGKIVKNFEYKTGINSSGRLVTKPTFVIPTKQYIHPETGAVLTYQQFTSEQERYNYLIVRSDRDLTQSFDRDGVGYTHVKVSRPGSGSTEYDFGMPAAYGSGVSGEWIATDNKFVRPSSCLPMDIVSNGGRWSFNYSPNPNFDFDRGFLLKRTDLSSGGTKVREVTYTPQYIYKSGTTPFKVWGVSYEHYANSSNIFFYGKYFLITDVAKAPSIETEINYDANDVSKNVTTSSQYFYESMYHKLLSKTRVVGPEGSVVTTKMKYPLDFGTITATNGYLKGIKTLQEKFRNATPIEVTTAVQRAGDVEKIIGASLTKFSDFGILGKAYPAEILSLKIDQGITDFVGASIDPGLNQLSCDTRYKTDATFLNYGKYGNPISSVGASRIPVTTVLGYDQSIPVVQATNVLVNQFAFSNFETDADSVLTGYEFQHNPYGWNSGGRTGNYCYLLGGPISKTLEKANVSKYKLSFWLKKSTSASVDINIKLKNSSNVEVYSNTINVTPATNNFEYVEALVPVTSVSSSTFTIVIQTVSAGYAYIDDIGFYPENADLVLYTHNIPFGANSITDATGSTIFVVHDGLGRERFVKDQDGNIIRKTTYKFATDQAPAFTAEITTPSPIIEKYQATFTANENSCVNTGDVTYEWDFGSGFQNLGITTSYTFPAYGDYPVTLRKKHPAYPTVTQTIIVHVAMQQLTAEVCAKGVAEKDCMTVISSYDCAAIPGTPSTESTTFLYTNSKVGNNPLPVGESVAPGSIQWFSSVDNGVTWTAVGTGTTVTVSGGPGQTTLVRCFVTTSVGRSGYSSEWDIVKILCK